MRRGENIYRRKDGRWEARYIRGRRNGKTLYGYLYGQTYSEVRAMKAAAMSSPERAAVPRARTNVTFESLASLWLASVKPTVKESTYARYLRAVGRYLTPIFGQTPLARIDREVLASLPERLMSEGGLRKGRLSPGTTADLLCVLRAVFRYGEQNGYPAPDLSCMKVPQRARSPVRVPTDGHREELVRRVIGSEDPVSLGILFSLFTGVRIGELCGLRWGDVDFPSSVVTVSRTIGRISDPDPLAPRKTKIVISEPKTECSRRVIPLPAFLLSYLEERRRDDGCYLLTGSARPTEPHLYYMRYKRWLKRNGMADYSFHALRHSFATCCMEHGFDAKSLSEILGHACISTTLSLYVHPTLRQKREQMERLSPEGLSPSDTPSEGMRNGL